LCRQALVKADQGVKVLEKLSERQLVEYLQAEDRKEARTLEEAWSAGRFREMN
jgi:flagellar export protein FliJ